MRKPIFAAAAFGIIREAPEMAGILLVREKGKSGKWKLPGGSMEFGELPEQTVAREIHEEVGINIFRPEVGDIVYSADKGNHIFFVYECRWYNGQIRPGEEIEEISFFSRYEIGQMIGQGKIVYHHAKALEKYFV